MLAPGEAFEGYTVDGVLGHGGYATVYRARRGCDGGVVALKVLDDQHRHLAQLARLRREFEFAHRADHPHVVTVYERGTGWLSMEVIAGGSASVLATVPDRLAALAQVADALDHIHSRGIVHCDVKTANILVHEDFPRDGVALIDFGVARAVTDDIGYQADHVEASMPYAAPELLTGHAPTEATDEYALACTAVELLTGTTPFTDDSRVGQARAHLHSAPPQRSREIDWLPRVFDSILAKAMAKDPRDRYQSCREFVSLIVRALR